MNYKGLNKVDRLWCVATIFTSGWIFALPVTDEAMPIWLTPVQLVHGVFIHELLLMVYLGFLFVTRGGQFPVGQRNGRTIALLIGGIGCLGILSTGVNFRPLREMGGAGRYFMLSAYFLISVHWAKRHGPTFVLRTLLLGIAASGAINLYYSFIFRWKELGGLPFLLGQNGPGGFLGLSVVLGAWLMLERKSSIDVVIAVVSTVIGLLAVSISYSKLSMLMAGSGIIAWVFVFCLSLTERRSRKLSFGMLIFLIVIAFINQGLIRQYVEGVNTFIAYKLIGPISENRSVESRSQYFQITAEIMMLHPLFGVGYGGFYDAATATKGYKSDRAAEEDALGGQKGESNPHSSFLYYGSANGVAGLFLAGFIFVTASRLFWRALSGRGLPGRVLWGCLIVAYSIFGLTLPTLFKTAILYLPVAVSVALASQARLSPPLLPDGPTSISS